MIKCVQWCVALIVVGLSCSCKTQQVKSSPLIDKNRKIQRVVTVLNVDVKRSTISWIGKKVTGHHKGGFRQFKGVVRRDQKKRVVSVEFVVDTVTLWSDNKYLTGHLKSADFLFVTSYPKATFKSTTIIANPTSNSTHTVTGAMNIHGIEQTITFPAMIRVSKKGVVSAKAEFALDRTVFDITYKGRPSDLIDEDVAMIVEFSTVEKPLRFERVPSR